MSTVTESNYAEVLSLRAQVEDLTRENLALRKELNTQRRGHPSFDVILEKSFSTHSMNPMKYRARFFHTEVDKRGRYHPSTTCVIERRKDITQPWKDNNEVVAQAVATVNVAMGDEFNPHKGRVLSYKRALEAFVQDNPEYNR